MTSPRRAAIFLLLSLAAGGIPVPPAAAAETAPDGWRILALPGKSVARFAAEADGTITVTAKDSVGFLVRDAAKVSGEGHYLAWKWRVDAAPGPTDLSVIGMDDRPLAVHVWFPSPDGSGSDWTLAERLAAWLQDTPLPGRMLTYVWGGNGRRGDHLRNPYREANGQIIVLRAGNSPTGQWFSETVDVAADFVAAFGGEPISPAYVVISADTDDKGGTSVGAVAGLAFRAAP